MNIKVEHIIIGLLVLLIALDLFDKVETPQIDEVALQVVRNERDSLININNTLDSNIKHFQYEILHNDSIVDNADIHQLDSMFTKYFNR